MNYRTKEDVMKRVQEHYDAAVKLYGERVLGVFLQGSWNYGFALCDEQSDVDTKCIVLPTFEDFCLGRKMVSTTHVLENGEHLDAKDLRLYMDCFKKQNINFVEILFTEFKVVNPKYEAQWGRLVDAREQVGRYNMRAALNCMTGMVYEKDKALTHPYPTLVEKLEKYGYDGKQLSHAFRMYYFMGKYLAGAPYKVCLKVENYFYADHLRRVKRNETGNLTWAKEQSKALCELTKEMKDNWIEQNPDYKPNKEVEALMNDVCVKCMKLTFLDYLDKGE